MASGHLAPLPRCRMTTDVTRAPEEKRCRSHQRVVLGPEDAGRARHAPHHLSHQRRESLPTQRQAAPLGDLEVDDHAVEAGADRRQHRPHPWHTLPARPPQSRNLR